MVMGSGIVRLEAGRASIGVGLISGVIQVKCLGGFLDLQLIRQVGVTYPLLITR